jgi:AraC family transcriptional regulator of adaptative response/methylated-DNA-[protein]-cysteine methyltransferase
MKCVARIETGDGVFSAVFSDNGLAELSFPDRPCRVQATDDIPKGWEKDTAAALECVLRGEQPERLPPLDFSKGTLFQQKVWRALLEIPAGETRSYGEIAAAVGEPGAARAVGAACGANPIPVLVPCHRVLAAHKKLGGFSAGLKWKRLLLEREASRAGNEFKLSIRDSVAA